MKPQVEKQYREASGKYASLAVDTEAALKILQTVSISLNCWQGDDVSGFEKTGSSLSGGGIQVTGNYPGKPRNMEEFRQDIRKAFSLIPGNHRLNLHSIYGEFDRFTERNEYEPRHFRGWADWAKDQKLSLDFNSTCFSHPMAESGFTLSSQNEKIRKFWIEHVRRTRHIAAFLGAEQSDPCLHNHWIPDGFKDLPADRYTHRKLLEESLDEIFTDYYQPEDIKDSLESKLFGIGSEAYTVGSHEFYLGYILKNRMMLCLDMGHFHPTESVADKISAILLFSEELLLHISRGIRWDSDHVAILNDDINSLTQEICRGRLLPRVHFALDFFDGSINRVGAWAIGTRALLKSLLIALLEPTEMLVKYEEEGNYFARLALMEEMKTFPFGAVWDYYCESCNMPTGMSLLDEVHSYEKNVLSKR